MQRGDTVLLDCRISRGGFSGERVFRLSQANGQPYVGAAPVAYCLHTDRTPLKPDEPAKGQPINGLVTGIVIFNGGDTVRVEVPNSEVIEVRVDQIDSRREEVTRYVPLRP